MESFLQFERLASLCYSIHRVIQTDRSSDCQFRKGSYQTTGYLRTSVATAPARVCGRAEIERESECWYHTNDDIHSGKNEFKASRRLGRQYWVKCWCAYVCKPCTLGMCLACCARVVSGCVLRGWCVSVPARWVCVSVDQEKVNKVEPYSIHSFRALANSRPFSVRGGSPPSLSFKLYSLYGT